MADSATHQVIQRKFLEKGKARKRADRKQERKLCFILIGDSDQDVTLGCSELMINITKIYKKYVGILAQLLSPGMEMAYCLTHFNIY